MSEASGAQENEFGESPQDQARRWSFELEAARKNLRKFHEDGDNVIKKFLDDRDSEEMSANGETRWNLFASTVKMKQAMLYGNTPSVDVSRRFSDASDDVARVASEMLERILNTDIEKADDTFSGALENSLENRLLPGIGFSRVRYEAKFETVKTEAITGDDGVVLAEGFEQEQKTYECAHTDYKFWKDVFYSPCRTWDEVRWVAFGEDLSRKQMVQRFGDKGKLAPLNSDKARNQSDSTKVNDPWARARVWEIWDKADKKVYWYVEGMSEILDEKEDPLGLDNFFPCPKPMTATVTTSSFVPKSDYHMAKDLYNEINSVSTRVTLLERAIRVAGVYDKTAVGVQRLISEARNNELIPVENWAMFAEKGGIKGQIDWLPLDQVTIALTALRDYRRELMDALYQITGMSDISRGQQTANGTPGEAQLKTRFASILIQRMQDEFARFATDLQRLKAEIVAKHFDVATIIKLSNIEFTPDAPLAQQAAELIKSKFSDYRIEVKSETVAMTDFSAKKQERLETMTAIAGFLQTMGPLAQQMGPSVTPFLLQILQWTVSGLRGSSGIETILDQAIQTAQQAQQQAAQNPPQQQPDPKLIAQQMKGQQDQQKIQLELQADIARTQAEVQADAQREQNQMQFNVREHAQKAMISESLRPKGVPGNGFKK